MGRAPGAGYIIMGAPPGMPGNICGRAAARVTKVRACMLQVQLAGYDDAAAFLSN